MPEVRTPLPEPCQGANAVKSTTWPRRPMCASGQSRQRGRHRSLIWIEPRGARPCHARPGSATVGPAAPRPASRAPSGCRPSRSARPGGGTGGWRRAAVTPAGRAATTRAAGSRSRRPSGGARPPAAAAPGAGRARATGRPRAPGPKKKACHAAERLTGRRKGAVEAPGRKNKHETSQPAARGAARCGAAQRAAMDALEARQRGKL